MPKIAEIQTVLNGRGSIVRFASGTSVGNYVYREWDNSTRNYRTKHILEAQTMDEAILLAPQIAIELSSRLSYQTYSFNEYRSFKSDSQRREITT